MKKSLIRLIALSVTVFTIVLQSNAQSLEQFMNDNLWTKQVGSQNLQFNQKEFNVSQYGAKNDGVTLNTQSIQKAIDDCAKSGGGMVVFDKGSYHTGSVFVKKGVELRIDKGVVLLGSQSISDYPLIDTRVAGVEIKWPAALINIIDQENAAITGEGEINARGKVFWEKYLNMRKEYNPKGLRWIVDYDCQRPRTILVQNSTNITVKGLTIKQAGFWTVQVVYSKHVSVIGLTIHNNIDGKGPSTDGIDIDSSSFVLVEGCDIDCNDDNYCLKAGRDADGLRVSRATEYVVLRNCISRKGGGTLVCGSETSGSIRHILAYNMRAIGSSCGVRLKSAITRGGTVEDINIFNFTIDSVSSAMAITMNWNPTYSYSTLPASYNFDSIPNHWKVMLKQVSPAQGTPCFKNIRINGLKGSAKKAAMDVAGMMESYADNFSLSNVDITSATSGKISFASNWKFENVTIACQDSSKFEVENCTNVSVDDIKGVRRR